MTPVVNSWWGNLPFSLEDPVSRQALAIGQKYVDPYTRAYDAGSAAAAAFLCAHGAGFTTAIAALRDLARPVQNVLLDELEFRWANPDAPEGLYVITHEVEPRGSGCSLIADHKRVGTRAWSTKVGKAKRSLVGRLAGYRNAYRHALIPDATLSVRGRNLRCRRSECPSSPISNASRAAMRSGSTPNALTESLALCHARATLASRF